MARKPAVSVRGGLRERLRAKALERELKRIRQLLELDSDAYSDLYVMQKCRHELAQVHELYDDELSEIEEEEMLEDGDE